MTSAPQLSPAELAALEQAFSTDPASGAYAPLAEAYLAMGRFMEAMVVCKKGIKNHPTDPSARVLLARIHAAQARDAKALEELSQATVLAPRDVAANRLLGALKLRAGDRAAATAALRIAWEGAPQDPDTLEVMRKAGIAFQDASPAASAPPPAAASGVPAAAIPSAGASAKAAPRDAGSSAGAGSPPTGSSELQAGAPQAPAGPAAPGASAAAPPAAAAAASQRRDAAAYSAELAARYQTHEYALPRGAPARRGHRAPVLATIGLGLALAMVLAGWGIMSSVRKARAVEIDRLLRQTRELIDKDSFAAYREAAAVCQRILDRDRDAVGGHAYLAYIDALRWAELGEGEALREEARKHLEAVKRLGVPHSHAYAAEAYLRFRGGDAKGAVAELQKVLSGPEGASPLLRGVLGILELEAGDLDGAREALTVARQGAPGDVRIVDALAEQWRRRGQGYEAQANALYDAILTRLAPDHVPSLLGKALVLLDAGQPGEALKRVTRALDLGQAASPRQIAVAQAVRGSILHAQGKAAEGDAAEQQALALDPSNPEVHDLVGRRKLRSGDVSGAVESFQKAVQLDPERLGFHVDLASALMKRPGGAREAVAALERASDRAGNARITKLLGDAYRAAGEPDRARATYEKALGMEKKYPEAHVALATLHRERRDWPKALEELDRAIKDYGDGPGSAPAWVDVAEIEEARGGGPAAVEKAYASALKADPQSCPALFWFGRSRADRKGAAFDGAFAKRALSDYVRLCPRGARVGDAQRLLASLESPAAAPLRHRRRR